MKGQIGFQILQKSAHFLPILRENTPDFVLLYFWTHSGKDCWKALHLRLDCTQSLKKPAVGILFRQSGRDAGINPICGESHHSSTASRFGERSASSFWKRISLKRRKEIVDDLCLDRIQSAKAPRLVWVKLLHTQTSYYYLREEKPRQVLPGSCTDDVWAWEP